MEWYYAINNEQLGPVSEDELRRLYDDGKIYAQTLVWCESMPDWQPYVQAVEQVGPAGTSAPTPPPQPGMREQAYEKIPSRMTLSIVALCLSVPVFCLLQCPGFLPLVLAIIGLVFSMQVGSRRQNGDYEGARSCSSTARIMGIISLLFSTLMILALVAFIVFMVTVEGGFDDNIFQPVGDVQSEMRSMAVAAEAYYVDYNTYPDALYQMTTPVSYLASIPQDPHGHGDTIQYAKAKITVDGEEREKYVFWSVGPDGYQDFNPNSLEERLDKEPSNPENAFKDITFDPVNGANSSGDIFHFGF